MRWCHLDYALIENDEGRPYRAVISYFDNTEQWERELLARSAKKDIMTGIYNHASAEGMIKDVLAQESGEQCCLLIIDLDDLREINSALGHPEGDRALKAIADCMTLQFRDKSILGRMGGDEFVALLRNVADTEQMKDNVNGFMSRLESVKIGPLNDRPVHVSIGGVLGMAGCDDFKTLYERADLAMYYTKAMGKNAFNLYEPGLEKRDFSYYPRSEASLIRMDSFDPTEFRKLLQAVSAYFPMVISVNLTQNTYYMMEYMAYAMRRHQDKGNFDQLIVDGANSFHPEDRAGFVASFSRENLLQAYARGERMVRHVGRQLGDDGIYREAQGVVVFVQDESTDDICEITFSHMVPVDEVPVMKEAAAKSDA